VTILYIPVFKLACSYPVSLGRRWSVIEHLLLVKLAQEKLSLDQITRISKLPRRLVIEALINLLRAGWIEMRSTDQTVLFGTTPAGARRASEEDLPVQVNHAVKWASLCVDRLTGAWFRSDDLQLVYRDDLPRDAELVDPRLHSFEPRDLPRELLYLSADEALEPAEPSFRTPSRPYARVDVTFDRIEGLPGYSPLDLQSEIAAESEKRQTSPRPLSFRVAVQDDPGEVRVHIAEKDIAVGGEAHWEFVTSALERAKSTVIIHSCFLHPEVVGRLVPHFEKAARRKVRVELLWGLVHDPEDTEKRKAIPDSEKALEGIAKAVRSRVQMSTISSRSHSKMILYDDKSSGDWVAIVGSCNWLSSWYDAIDVSLRVANAQLVGLLLNRLIATQQPAAGGWPPLSTRLNRVWQQVRLHRGKPNGDHKLRLISDNEHYAIVTAARDAAIESSPPADIVVGCDLYGLSAETAVLTPLETAAAAGCGVTLLYQRPSRYLEEEGRRPDAVACARRGLFLERIDKLHGKFLICGDDEFTVSSFNWLSTALDGTRSRNAEFGLLVAGKHVARLLRKRLGEHGLRDVLAGSQRNGDAESVEALVD
jgi:phosphatidylserine/phosphatidylglycerophosphate/cardiolipin synthase-like enzyme